MKRKLLLFLGGIVGIWILSGPVAWQLWGETGLVDSIVALAICVVPMAATLVVSHLATQSARPHDQVAAAFGGTGIRMLVAVLGGIALYSSVPQLNHPGFLFAVIGYYLATLVLEVAILVGTQATQAKTLNLSR